MQMIRRSGCDIKVLLMISGQIQIFVMVAFAFLQSRLHSVPVFLTSLGVFGMVVRVLRSVVVVVSKDGHLVRVTDEEEMQEVSIRDYFFEIQPVLNSDNPLVTDDSEEEDSVNDGLSELSGDSD